MTSYAFTVPIRTVSEMNARGSWRLRDNRGRDQKRVMGLALNANMPPRKYVTLPCVVKLTRISAGTLDDDNLRSALKACRDAIAKWIGVDDGKTELVQYQYEQEKCVPKMYAVRVTVMPGARLEERVISTPETIGGRMMRETGLTVPEYMGVSPRRRRKAVA